MDKSRVLVGDKVIKLREERQLFARFLVIQQSRPELVPKLASTIGDYEMAVVPRSMFAVDGSLLVCKEKSDLMNIIEGVTVEKEADGDRIEDIIQPQVIEEATDHLENLNDEIRRSHVLIVDAMAILQGMKKTPGMVTIWHLKEAFLKKVFNMSRNYDEVRVIFDHYLENSLKSKTRAVRATSDAASKAKYDVHDQMCIKTLSLKELFSSSYSKNGLTKLLSEALIHKSEGSSKNI